MEENQVKIPEGWKIFKGDEILKVQGGYAFKSDEYKDEGTLLVRIGNVGNGNFEFKDVVYIPKRFQLTHSNFQLWRGDVLMGLTGDLGKICMLQNGDFPYFLNQRVGKFVPSDKINNQYLFYLVSSSSVQSKFDAFFAGGAQKNISPKQIESVNFLIPKSTTEQAQIATILSKVDEAISQTEQLIAKYSRIKTGLMQDLLTKGIDENGKIRSEETHEFKDSPLGRIPKEWSIVSLGNFSEISSGLTLGKEYPEYGTEAMPYLRVANVQDGYLDLNEIKYIRVPYNQIGKLLLKKGDVLMNEGGDFDKLGRGTVWNDEIPNCLHQNHVFKVRLDKQKMLPEYLAFYSASSYGKIFFIVSSKQSTNLASINKTQLLGFPIIKPELIEQHRIINVLDNYSNLLKDHETNLSKLQSIKTGLMQDLLSGKVRVNHLMDEKAKN